MSKFQVPKVGSIITVTTRYADHYYLSDKDYKDTTYERVEVIKPFKWTKPDCFCIPAEGEPFITVRTIAISKVIDLVVHEGDVEAANTGTKYVYVPGSKGNEYMVTVVDGYGVECTCPGYHWRKHCKHLEIASDKKAA